MGLKYYLNLFKKDSNNETVKLRYFLNVFVFLVYMVLFAVFTSLRSTNIVISSVFGMLALVALIIHRLLNKDFPRLIEKLIAEETLGNDDEADKAFIAYRKGYADFNENNKLLDKKLLPLNVIINIISFALIIAILPATIIVNLIGDTALAETIFLATSYIMFVYFALILALGAFLGSKGVWYQEYSNELAIINKYKSANSDSEVKYKILEDKKPNKQFEYLFPDNGKCNRYQKLQKLSQTSGTAGGFILGIGLIAIPQILSTLSGNEALTGIITGSIFGGGIAILITIIVIISYLQKKLMREQYLNLKANETKYCLYIILHELRTPFYKRWNMLLLVCFLGAVFSNIIFGSVTAEILKTDSYGWIFFLLTLIEIITLFVIYSKAFGRLRLRMMKIEKEIDRINAANEKE